jgi:hypothetical protein
MIATCVPGGPEVTLSVVVTDAAETGAIGASVARTNNRVAIIAANEPFNNLMYPTFFKK